MEEGSAMYRVIEQIMQNSSFLGMNQMYKNSNDQLIIEALKNNCRAYLSLLLKYINKNNSIVRKSLISVASNANFTFQNFMKSSYLSVEWIKLLFALSDACNAPFHKFNLENAIELCDQVNTPVTKECKKLIQDRLATLNNTKK